MDEDGLWTAMRALATQFRLAERAGTDAGVILDPIYGEELAWATLNLRDGGRLWLGLKDRRVIVESE